MKFKRILFVYILAATALLPLCAQGFKLYFSNNVSDVVNFAEMESDLSGLTWREVKNGDMAGNQVEVDAVKRMFASTAKKGLTEQRQFWTMRDHNLLCFRINDGKGTSGSFEVSVVDGKGFSQSVTVSRYFYVNVPRQDDPVTIRVRPTNRESDSISFKYYIYDWDDDNLYTFQLDSKRQALGEAYSLEYVLSHIDAQGEKQVTTTTLELQGKTFQSFYVGEGETLQDVFLKQGDRKLRLNKARLHPGVTLDPDYGTTKLSASFHLDKHENRELVNFNWIGSGLYERYDTLYVSLFNGRGKTISQATVNVESVDADGQRAYEPQVRYDGYDRRRKTHRIITMGKPACLEILASGCVPTLYRYPGAADAVTGIVDETRCAANIILKSNKGNTDDIVFSSQHLKALNDTKTVTVINGKDHSVCDITDYDISLIPKADTLRFTDDAGNDWPKVLGGEKVERYARLELIYSTPRGSRQPSATMMIDPTAGGETVALINKEVTMYGTEFPSFTRTYYVASFDLTPPDFQDNTCYRVYLHDGNKLYTPFPFLTKVRIERKELEEKAQETANKQMDTPKTENISKMLADGGFNLGIPATVKFKVTPFSFKVSAYLDFLKQMLTVSLSASLNGPDEEDNDPQSEMRKEAKEYTNGIYQKTGHKIAGNDVKKSLLDSNPSMSDWMINELDDIFNIQSARIGVGWFGGAKLAFSVPLLPNASGYLQLKQLSMNVGYGAAFFWGDYFKKYYEETAVGRFAEKIKKDFNMDFNLGAVVDVNAMMEGGLKTFRSDLPSSTENFGPFINLKGTVKVGGWGELVTPPNPWLYVNAGLRAGVKLNLGIGAAGCFRDMVFYPGFNFTAVAGLYGFADLRLPFVQLTGRFGVGFGKRWYIPDDGTNPLHPKFPFWLPPKKSSAPSLSRSIKTLTADDLGEPIIEQVAGNANPHLIDDTRVVVNLPGTAADAGMGYVGIFDDATSHTDTLSTPSYYASNHNRSKRAAHEIVVYEQTDFPTKAGQTQQTDDLLDADTMAVHNNIIANIRAEGEPWRQTVVAASGDGLINAKPVVTIQEDGKAACVWQRGRSIRTFAENSPDGQSHKILAGYLVLSVYDGDKWSEPVELYIIDEEQQMSQYDLVMRGDTVLVGQCVTEYPFDSIRRHSTFHYTSVPIATREPDYRADEMNPLQIFMNRVGEHAVAAMLYEKCDSTREIYVKTLRMDGSADGILGSDIGANLCTPQRMKIICDRSVDRLNDFAVLWTETNNILYGEDGKVKEADGVHTLLNASRISLLPTPCITPPITMGGERDSLMLYDYDGYLDDTRIKVVYSLSDPNTGEAVVMENERYFTNSFVHGVSYTKQHLLGGSTLPIAVTVRNTGTSSIRSVTATINGQDFVIPNSFVAPLRQQTFTVDYPVTDSFDGYIRSAVEVTYDNMFRVQRHPRRGTSLRVQRSAQQSDYINMEDVECRLIGHTVEDGVNSLLVEVIDHTTRGLGQHNVVKVGVYPHPGLTEPLNDQAETSVTADDFVDMGGVRKAYVTVDVPGIMESTTGYLNLHIMNDTIDVDNLRANENTHYVTLLPAEEPTAIEQMRLQDVNHTLTCQRQQGGLLASGLKAGDTLRVFSADGYLVYRATATGSDLSVPLSVRGVYLLSTVDDTIKYNY